MTDEELLEVVRGHPDRAVTAREVAEEVDMTSAGVLKRLDELSQQGELRRKKVGSRAVVWWVREG